MTNPTGYTALDLVGFTDKGAYAGNVYYVKNDLVHYGGNIWRCLIDDTMAIAPTEGLNWTLFIGEPTNLVERIIAPIEQTPSEHAYVVGNQLIFADNLYEVIAAISVDDVLVTYETSPSTANIKLAPPVETQLLDVKAKEGTLSSLTTNEKNTLVGAINEVDGNADAANTAIGTLSSLNTTEKNSVVGAINEVDSHTDTNTAYIGTLANLTTTAKTDLVAAINEVDSHADANATAIVNGIQNAIEVTTPTFSALPVTFTVQGMTADHKLIQEGSAFVSNPSAQLDQWTLTTGANTLTISGTISGSTYIVASFGIKRAVTATSSS